MIAPLALDGAGLFRVEIGPRWSDRLVARCSGHRRSGDVLVQMVVERLSDGEQRWVRTIDGRCCATTVRHEGSLFVEACGPIELTFVHRPGSTTVLRLVGWRLRIGRLAVPLPRRLAPPIRCSTRNTDGGLHVAVRIGRRPSVSYEGILS